METMAHRVRRCWYDWHDAMSGANAARNAEFVLAREIDSLRADLDALRTAAPPLRDARLRKAVREVIEDMDGFDDFNSVNWQEQLEKALNDPRGGGE